MTRDHIRRTRTMLMAACAALAMLPATAHAQQTSEPVSYNIAAQDLGTALTELARQSNREIYFSADLTRGKRAKRLSGKMTVEQALGRLLDGTGLRYRVNDNGSIVIQVGNGSADDGVSATEEDVSLAEDERGKAEILVVGSKSQNVDIRRTEDDPQPYVVLGSEEIRRSGASDVQSLLKEKLTAINPGISVSSQVANSITTNASKVSLRGLTDETLILVNGRRVASTSTPGAFSQPDLGGIPLSAVERIEVLPSTASGIYGGGSGGGVINVILKKNYNGLNISTTYENTFRTNIPSARISVSAGFTPDHGRTNIMINASYSKSEALLAGDRDFLADARALTLQNAPSIFTSGSAPPLGATTNIKSRTGVLSLKPAYGGAVLPANFTYVPYGYAGVQSDNGATLVANAGQFNLDLSNSAAGNGGKLSGLTNAPTIGYASLDVRHSFSSDLEAYFNLTTSENKGRFPTSSGKASYLLNSTDSANPFQQAIVVTTPAFGLDDYLDSKLTNLAAVAGAVLKLGPDWSLNFEYSWSRSRISISSPTPVTSPGSANVLASNIDIFRDTNVYPVDFAPYGLASTQYGPVSTTLNNPSLRISGKLPFALPGGRPVVTGLIEYKRESLADAYQLVPTGGGSSFFYPARRQSAASAYLEARLPLVSAGNNVPLVNLLEVQIAGRVDKYSTVAANTILLTASPAPAVSQKAGFETINPTISVRYRPVRDITFRGSYATGFLPPSVNQLVPGLTSDLVLTAANNLKDPRRGGEFVTGNVTLLSGGNPDLLPEESRSWSVGVIVTPRFAPGLRLSADLTDIRKRNNIAPITIRQSIIDNEEFVPGLVERAPATPQNDPQGYGVGPITTLNSRLLNFATANIRAIDFSGSYLLKTKGLGEFEFSLRGTHNLRSRSQVTPLSPTMELFDTLAAPNYLANASINWEKGSWSAGVQGQYLSRYFINLAHSVVPAQGSATIPSQRYFDAFVAYSFDSDRRPGSALSGLRIQLGAKNIFNTKPPIDASSNYGYSLFGDPRMARYYLSISKQF